MWCPIRYDGEAALLSTDWTVVSSPSVGNERDIFFGGAAVGAGAIGAVGFSARAGFPVPSVIEHDAPTGGPARARRPAARGYRRGAGLTAGEPSPPLGGHAAGRRLVADWSQDDGKVAVLRYASALGGHPGPPRRGRAVGPGQARPQGIQ